MIADERTVVYINSLDTGNSDYLNQIEYEALNTQVPIIRRETQSLLRFMLKSKTPAKILEVGTAVGFSALLMAENTPADTTITTIEKYEKRIPLAKENFAKSEYGSRITLLDGDAIEILAELSEKGEQYDFIFMDAAKGQYINFLPYVSSLLSKGGVLISDNVLQDGDIIESRFAVTRRDRTIHKRMREYLYELTHSEIYETTILPMGDGIAMSVRK